ncbi:patatin-like phospholipase domain-containing protein 2 [Sinocyclocheilus grahami]|uniref:patatin-like phospholipase domain-containing protein 2 n=1 Tax=Sinocyclocheilus grahami TaxID=75366 RepID=UPI0007AD345B|nr:PREDICTED: patatin-like phospholipase domain-containing protein 2 [Sinocyclocheilus grahami]
MKNMWKQVYRDALHFLKRNGLLQYGGPHRMLAVADGGAEEESDSEDDEESESREDRETLDHSSIEEHIFEHLPPRRLTLCCCSCRERRSLVQSLSNMLPVRMASAILLPYTLPLESAPSLSIRLLEWLPDIQEDVGWMKEQRERERERERETAQTQTRRGQSDQKLSLQLFISAGIETFPVCPGQLQCGTSAPGLGLRGQLHSPGRNAAIGPVPALTPARLFLCQSGPPRVFHHQFGSPQCLQLPEPPKTQWRVLPCVPSEP